MKKYASIAWYILLGIAIFAIDRFTKQVALANFVIPQPINSWLTFELTLNRGISWGILHSHSSLFFVLLSAVIVAMVLILAVYAFFRWSRGFYIIGETLALSGALSNIFDRVVYGGVIDFILFTVNGCAPFGIFNIADICIVTGIFIIFIGSYKND
jgi:signal peptidase II